MTTFLLLCISFLASSIGSITGIGGGIIVKPVVDALGLIDTQTISFLSGCMVLSMSLVSLWRSRSAGTPIRFEKILYLALGATVGGIVGKQIFQWIQGTIPNQSLLGISQNAVLLTLTLASFVYSLFKRRIQTRQLSGRIPKILCGLVLGVLSAFLGIGGGPFNLIALSYFFSMDSKTAAVNSLFIILFSQSASLIILALTGSIPAFDTAQLALMVFGGISGALTGSQITRKLSLKGVDTIFLFMLCFIILICTISIARFSFSA